MPRRTAPKSPVTSKKRAPAPVFTLEERLANGGLLSIDEVCALAQASRSFIYKAVREKRLAVYLAAFKDYRPYLSSGQRAMIVIVCPDRDQSANLLRFIGGMFDDSPTLGKLIERRDRDSFELSTRCTITIMTASFRTIRGYVISCAILDELAYMPGDDAALPATELIRSIKPALGDIPGSMLICASSPKGKNGPLWDAYTAHYGREDSRELFWKAPTLTMRPTFDEQIVKEAVEDDPVGAMGEYFAEFSDDVSACFSRAAVEDAVDPGCYERPPADFTYQAFVDVSGGTGKDSFTMAIAHIERHDGVDVAVLDVLFEARPPFKPDLIVRDCCRILADYGVSRIIGDRWPCSPPTGASARSSSTRRPAVPMPSTPMLGSGGSLRIRPACPRAFGTWTPGPAESARPTTPARHSTTSSTQPPIPRLRRRLDTSAGRSARAERSPRFGRRIEENARRTIDGERIGERGECVDQW